MCFSVLFAFEYFSCHDGRQTVVSVPECARSRAPDSTVVQTTFVALCEGRRAAKRSTRRSLRYVVPLSLLE
jgi:hypothetical protein